MEYVGTAQNAFYIVGVIFMCAWLALMAAAVIAVLAVRAKIKRKKREMTQIPAKILAFASGFMKGLK